MRCESLEVSFLDFDFVWVRLGASIGGGDDAILLESRAASLLAKGGESNEASGLTRSSSSLKSLAADLVRVYDGLIFVGKKNPGQMMVAVLAMAKKRTCHVHRHELDS